MKGNIYILKLENDKIYIGFSMQPKNRILQHFNKNGSEWTKENKPLSILRIENGDLFDEEKYTLEMMSIYGIDNVRGGSYSNIILNDAEKDKANKQILHLHNKCFKCGSKNHYATECEKTDINNYGVQKQTDLLIKLDEVKKLNDEEREKSSIADDHLCFPNMAASRKGERIKAIQELISQNILFDYCSSGVIEIIHPITKEKIKKSIRNDKVFCKNRWLNMPINIVNDWYKSNGGQFPKCKKCNLECSHVGKDMIFKICDNTECSIKWCN
jgi:hypothetical protein